MAAGTRARPGGPPVPGPPGHPVRRRGLVARPQRDRPEPWYTFDRDRERRSGAGQHGTPDDHQLPQPDDSPRRAGARAAGRTAPEPRNGAPSAGAAAAQPADAFGCPCPPSATSSTTGPGKPVHAEDARVGCDVGLTRCYRGRVRGSLLLTSRGEALS